MLFGDLLFKDQLKLICSTIRLKESYTMESEEPVECIFGTKVMKQSQKELLVTKVIENSDPARKAEQKCADAKERYFKKQAHFMRNKTVKDMLESLYKIPQVWKNPRKFSRLGKSFQDLIHDMTNFGSFYRASF